MKEITSSFTTEKPVDSVKDYSKSKDAYDGKLDSSNQTEPLPESSRPRKDGPGGE